MTKINILNHHFFCVLFSFLTISAVAQFKPVKIGDSVPDLLYREVTNYHKPSLRLSEFKGKYIILDFWGHHCISCLASFPKIDSIQKEYKNDIQIIAVNDKGNAETVSLFKRLKNLYLPSIPFVNADTALAQLFPHRGVPHHIWLDRQGRLMHAAALYNLNRDSLDKLIQGGNLNVLKVSKPIVVESLLDERFIASLGFASYIYKKGTSNFLLAPKKIKNGIHQSNSIANLFAHAFDGVTENRYQLLRPGRIVLEVDSPDHYQFQKDLKGRASVDWKAAHVYVYQSIFPATKKVNLWKIMVEDLERYFGVYGAIEKRAVKTITLVKTGNDDKLKSKGGKFFDSLLPTDARTKMTADTVRKLVNADYSLLAERLKVFVEYSLKLPFKDLTGYVGKVDFTIDGKILDKPTLAKLKEGLKNYNLDLVEQEVEYDVLVLRDQR